MSDAVKIETQLCRIANALEALLRLTGLGDSNTKLPRTAEELEEAGKAFSERLNKAALSGH